MGSNSSVIRSDSWRRVSRVVFLENVRRIRRRIAVGSVISYICIAWPSLLDLADYNSGTCQQLTIRINQPD